MRESRDKVFSLRFTQTEYETLKSVANRYNLSIGAYIRKIVLKEIFAL